MLFKKFVKSDSKCQKTQETAFSTKQISTAAMLIPI